MRVMVVASTLAVGCGSEVTIVSTTPPDGALDVLVTAGLAVTVSDDVTGIDFEATSVDWSIDTATSSGVIAQLDHTYALMTQLPPSSQIAAVARVHVAGADDVVTSWSFVTSADVFGPRLLQSAPAAGNELFSSISVAHSVSLTFDEPVLNAETGLHMTSMNIPLAAEVSYSDVSDLQHIATFSIPDGYPGEPGAPVIISADATVTDEHGNPAQLSVTYAAPARDERPPRLTISPGNGDVVPTNTPITLTFTERVQPFQDQIQVRSGQGEVVPGTLTTTDQRVWMFTPNAPFPASSSITGEVTIVRDLAGNQMEKTHLIGFATE